MSKVTMRIHTWEIRSGGWLWEVTDARGTRLAAQTNSSYRSFSQQQAWDQAKAWVDSHNGTISDWE